MYGVDPSVELGQLARKTAADGSTKVEFLSQSAEKPLPLATASMDTVVITWTPCSIPNAPHALEEMTRRNHFQSAMAALRNGRIQVLWFHLTFTTYAKIW